MVRRARKRPRRPATSIARTCRSARRRSASRSTHRGRERDRRRYEAALRARRTTRRRRQRSETARASSTSRLSRPRREQPRVVRRSEHRYTERRGTEDRQTAHLGLHRAHRQRESTPSERTLGDPAATCPSQRGHQMSAAPQRHDPPSSMNSSKSTPRVAHRSRSSSMLSWILSAGSWT